MTFNYMTVRQAAEKWGVSIRRVQQFCERGRLDGAVRPGREWLIPKDIEKPRDTRVNCNRKGLSCTKPENTSEKEV